MTKIGVFLCVVFLPILLLAQGDKQIKRFCPKSGNLKTYYLYVKEYRATLHLDKDEKFTLFISGAHLINRYSHGVVVKSADTLILKFDSTKIEANEKKGNFFSYLNDMFLLKQGACYKVISEYPFRKRDVIVAPLSGVFQPFKSSLPRCPEVCHELKSNE